MCTLVIYCISALQFNVVSLGYPDYQITKILMGRQIMTPPIREPEPYDRRDEKQSHWK